jgi:hypothetical protein
MVVGFDVVKLEGDFFGVGSFPWSFDHRMTIRERRNEISLTTLEQQEL